MSRYRIAGLSPEPFATLGALDDASLRAHGMRRIVADSPNGYPCRISLADATPGDSVLLLTFEHHPCDGPYRSSGPIYVREGATAASYDDALPAFLRTRTLSLRAYDADGWMRGARVAAGAEADAALAELLDDPDTTEVHAHNARTGCFMCRIDRL
ncbi:hypothetical protein GLA29479_4118 [Lysobacter antibioticus]|uniref:DUF1203 domain-containing protein n=1 Tax=Lysobacter antibioticus TaxID=84531 RepID=UPI000716FB99|nr:DUF1203 domain-containing protein [Lysobacter antibioticus]ALN64964.1 hypothetical protein GLA29479_4118 [Lysobacter antibioticus]